MHKPRYFHHPLERCDLGFGVDVLSEEHQVQPGHPVVGSWKRFQKKNIALQSRFLWKERLSDEALDASGAWIFQKGLATISPCTCTCAIWQSVNVNVNINTSVNTSLVNMSLCTNAFYVFDSMSYATYAVCHINMSYVICQMPCCHANTLHIPMSIYCNVQRYTTIIAEPLQRPAL